MYPLVVVEASAAGLPVIGVRSPGVGEIVTDGVSGALRAEDPEQLAAAMRAVSPTPSSPSGCGPAAPVIASTHDIKASTRELVAVYEKLLART